MNIKKNILLIYIMFFSILGVNAQVMNTEKPVMTYLQPIDHGNSFFQVGARLIFKQRCTNNVDSVIANGSVGFEKSIHHGVLGKYVLLFQDTILVRSVFEITGKNNFTLLINNLKTTFKEISCTALHKTYYFNWTENIQNTAVFHLLIYDGKQAKYIITL